MSQRSFLNRTFGSLEKGSLAGSTYQLSAAAIGAGVLSLPYVLKESGIILGLILILIGAFASILSLKLLMKCSDMISSTSYSDLVHKVYGHKHDRRLTILILTGLSGSCITYQIIILRLVQSLAQTINIELYSLEYSILITFLIGFSIIAPLSTHKEMSGFRYVSILSLASLFYILVVICIELPPYAR